MKFKIKNGDKVRVLAGDHKGSEGNVLKIFKSKKLVLVEGVNMVKKHNKPSSQNPKCGITEMESPIHISNLSFTFLSQIAFCFLILVWFLRLHFLMGRGQQLVMLLSLVGFHVMVIYF